MSSATPSTHASLTTEDRSLVSAWIGRLAYSVRATAFWIAAILPLFILATLFVDSVGQYPYAFAGALAINAVCAVIGHAHTPGRQ